MRPIDIFDQTVARVPERLLVCDATESVTYRQAQEQSWQIAQALLAHGLTVGDVVSTYAPNRARIIPLCMGLWRSGVTWNPLNFYNTVAANADMIARAHSKAVFIDESLHHLVPDVRDHYGNHSEHQTTPTFISLGEQGTCDISWDEFLSAQTDIPDWADVHGNPEHVCLIIGTGGTTGAPKLGMIDHSTFGALAAEVAVRIPGAAEGRYLIASPMTHAAGLMGLAYALFGAAQYVRQGFQAEAVLEQIAADRITHIFLPPTAFYDLLDAQQANPRDTSSVREVHLAASPVAPERLVQGVRLLGPVISQSYGQVEAPMMISYFSTSAIAEAAKERDMELLGSCGQISQLNRVAIVDEHDNVLPYGESGEIVVRGALVGQGYYQDAEKTAEAHRNGWLHTGDVGLLRADGYLFIKDRIKDMMITGGFNVYATEVESALYEHPGVNVCAVIGVPDERWGERIVAYVVPDTPREDASEVERPGAEQSSSAQPSEAELITFAKERLGSVKAPKEVRFVESLPHTAVGKIDKVRIRSSYAE